MDFNDGDEEIFQPLKRFRTSKSKEEEEKVLENAVPLSTRYKNKWAVNLFEEWRKARINNIATEEATSLNIPLEEIENLFENWHKMSPPSLNFWIGKFIQEVADQKGERYYFFP